MSADEKFCRQSTQELSAVLLPISSAIKATLKHSVHRNKCAPIWRKRGYRMTETKLTIADILLIAGTRVVLGAGIGLLVSTRLNNDQRKAAGLSLALIGGLTTIPIALGVIGKHRGSHAELRQAA
jgi:hypothetical protein